MFNIKTLDNISNTGLSRFPNSHYHINNDTAAPDAIIVRSHDMHTTELPPSVVIVGRAGAGTNNIPITKFTNMGIPVLNTPNANANAVKELVLAGMLMACRNLQPAAQFVQELTGDDATMNVTAEKNKKRFSGFELPGRTLGVIGLGAIGVKLANSALALGMKVIGYDPLISVRRAWELSAAVQQAHSLEELLKYSDFISLHVPLNDETRGLINALRLQILKPEAILLNFSRDGVVENDAVVTALAEKRLRTYVCDFPANILKGNPQVICLPHLGASTLEAEENCAIMIADQIQEYLEQGNIKNSVNFPDVTMPMGSGFRLTIANANVPAMVSQISSKLGDAGLNITDMINKSRGEIAYTLFDVDQALSAEILAEIKDIKGVLRVRHIPGSKAPM
ncbi:phosphoglycerate dehydrogenase [soil metagenome]